ncbi:glycine-rich domain-containing protein, partial [Streptomyces olivaceus]|uniref:glycine-rich domain-containing protein n=1 Tax=Streptomyces olivaceus TaxID=47716 RepID=UPI003641DD5C
LDDDGCLLVPAAEPTPLPVITMTTQVVTFEESGTFTPADYPGLQYVRVRAVAGGGGAAGIFASPAGEVHIGQAGGGGTYAESVINAADLPGPVPVTVGAGGTGVPARDDLTLRAGMGDPSSFGALVVAANGSAALGTFTGLGQKGNSHELFRPGGPRTRGGSVGQIIVNGEQGGDGIGFGPDALGPEHLLIGCAYGGRSFLSLRASGGSATWDAGGGAVVPPVGPNANGWGGGAPAPHSGGGQANEAIAGGDGSSGVVIVEVYQLQVTAA